MTDLISKFRGAKETLEDWAMTAGQAAEALACAQQQTEDLRVANERLQQELASRQQVEQELQQRTVELDEARQQWHSEAEQRQRIEGELQQHREQLNQAQQQTEDLRVANERLQQELASRQQVEEQLQQRTVELDEARQQLQSEIEQRQRLESELQQRREVATKGIAVIDLGGTVHYVNQGWVEMHGYSRKAELIGKPISAFHTSEQWETEVTPFIKEAKRRGQLCGPIEHIRNDGRMLPTETTVIRLGSKEGEPIGFIVFATEGSKYSHTNQQVQREAVESVTADESIQGNVAGYSRSQDHFEQEVGDLATITEQLEPDIAGLKRQEAEPLERTTVVEQPRERMPALRPEELRELSEIAERLL